MKVRLGIALLAIMGISSAYAQDTTSEKGKLSYAIGFEIGQDFNERKIDVDLNTVIRAIQDGYAKRTPAVAEDQMRTALEQMQAKLQEQLRTEIERVSTENKTKSTQFLAQNRAKSGIVVLPSGLQYRVIDEGTGGRPASTSEVRLHFRGSLHTGQEFASTYQGNNPVTMKVSDAPLKGLQEALPLMKAGARWELYMPSELAYGDSPRSPIGPSQAVVFDVTLVEVK